MMTFEELNNTPIADIKNAFLSDIKWTMERGNKDYRKENGRIGNYLNEFMVDNGQRDVTEVTFTQNDKNSRFNGITIVTEEIYD